MFTNDGSSCGTEEKTKELLLMHSLVLANMAEGVSVCDENGIFVLTNPAFERMFGYDFGELKGEHMAVLNDCSKEESGKLFAEISHILNSVGSWSGEFSNRKKNGMNLQTNVRITAMNASGRIYWITVQEDISDRKAASAEIALLHEKMSARAAELEAANQELEAFSYSLSHDLRKPLTRIQGYSEVALEQCSDLVYRPCKDYLQEIYAGAECMNKLIDTILELSMMGKKEVKQEQVCLSDLVTTVALELKITEPQRGVKFHIAEGIIVNGDAELLRVALENLINNAWKYTAQKEEALIIFGVTELNGRRTYFICDNGVGFDMAQSDKIFTPFKRLANADKYEGFGIGLTTAKRIINRHGGQIWAEGSVGTGATFYFTL